MQCYYHWLYSNLGSFNAVYAWFSLSKYKFLVHPWYKFCIDFLLSIDFATGRQWVSIFILHICWNRIYDPIIYGFSNILIISGLQWKTLFLSIYYPSLFSTTGFKLLVRTHIFIYFHEWNFLFLVILPMQFDVLSYENRANNKEKVKNYV